MLTFIGPMFDNEHVEDFWLRALPYMIGAVALLGVTMVIRPRWFRNWRVHPFGNPDIAVDEGPGYRIGRLGPGGIRALGIVMAVVFTGAAAALHFSIADRFACADAQKVWSESNGSVEVAGRKAAELGYRIEVIERQIDADSSQTVVYVLKGDRRVAGWTHDEASVESNFSCGG